MKHLAVPIIDKCYESLLTALDDVNSENDSNQFTET